MSRTSNRSTLPRSVAVLAVTALAGQLAAATPALAQGENRGEVEVDLRYRFETVDQPSFDADAAASTLRTALSYRTPAWRGWSLFLQAENVVGVPDDDDYNNAGRGGDSNGVFDRPVVADPESTEMNQAFLRWSDDRVTVTLGRQEMNIGDQRFVGAVGWRQNHQSFDAARVQWHGSRIDVDYAYLAAIHRIIGDRLDGDFHLLTAPLRWGDDDLGGTVTAYGYLLDYGASGPVALSSRTFGVEWRGKADRWHWELEAARQDDAGDNPHRLDGGYLHGEIGASWKLGVSTCQVALDWESLEGGARGSFQTPLATLHKFNGWADLFLTTPLFGVETTALRFGGQHGAWSWIAAFLDHRAEAAGIDYGTEIDGQLSWKSDWGQVFALKLASYDADGFGQDTDKVMFFTTYSFGN